MKYIKTYEQNDELDNLKVGDYVLVDCRGLNKLIQYGCKNKEVGVVEHEPEETLDGFVVVIRLMNSETITFYDYEIIKKLTPEEVGFYTSLIKYNL